MEGTEHAAGPGAEGPRAARRRGEAVAVVAQPGAAGGLEAEKLRSRTVVWRGRLLGLSVDRVALPGGGEASREVVDHPGAVVVAALTDDGRVLLVEQYRYPAGEALTEAPAGKLEPGEDPLSCARRELEEETGFSASQWEAGPCFYSSPGFCSEKLHLFFARGLTSGKPANQPDERIKVRPLPLEEALALADRGGIRDAKTLVVLYLLARRR